MRRRDFLMGSAAAAGALGYAGFGRASAPAPQELAIQTARFTFREQPTQGMISLSPDAPPPVICGTQGQPMHLRVRNLTPDYTAMHWHGLRIPNAMDGVPYLTQMPIGGGESFDYTFTPPDAGTYWYHPHCMTMSQMARGLTGVMVIREADDPGFDGDQAAGAPAGGEHRHHADLQAAPWHRAGADYRLGRASGGCGGAAALEKGPPAGWAGPAR